MLFYPCSMTTTTTVVKVACDIAVYCTICFAIHLLLHTRSLQIEIRCPSGAEPSGRISGLQTALAREDGNIVSDASFDLTAIWTERSCSSSSSSREKIITSTLYGQETVPVNGCNEWTLHPKQSLPLASLMHLGSCDFATMLLIFCGLLI